MDDYEWPYIAKFYYSNDPQYVDFLWMEYYPHKSLDYFKANFTSTMSLNTKIYLLFQIAQGIRFLISKQSYLVSKKDFAVYHLDIKPANVLVTIYPIISRSQKITSQNCLTSEKAIAQTCATVIFYF